MSAPHAFQPHSINKASACAAKRHVELQFLPTPCLQWLCLPCTVVNLHLLPAVQVLWILERHILLGVRLWVFTPEVSCQMNPLFLVFRRPLSSISKTFCAGSLMWSLGPISFLTPWNLITNAFFFFQDKALLFSPLSGSSLPKVPGRFCLNWCQFKSLLVLFFLLFYTLQYIWCGLGRLYPER